MMKLILKLGIFLAILLSSLLGLSQSKSAKLYELFANEEGVTSLSFSKSVLKPFELFIDEETKQVIYKMDKISFMSYNENKGDLKTDDVYNRICKELSGGNYFKIDPNDINCENCNIHVDDEKDLTLIGLGSKKEMSEFHIIVYEDNLCLIFSFFGKITIDDIKECGKFTKSTKEIGLN